MTVFSTKLTAIEQSRAKPSTKALDELQEAFMRLGATSQRTEIESLRERADDKGSKKLGDLADLLQNVVKPADRKPAKRTVTSSGGKNSGGSAPATRDPAPRTVYRSPGSK